MSPPCSKNHHYLLLTLIFFHLSAKRQNISRWRNNCQKKAVPNREQEFSWCVTFWQISWWRILGAFLVWFVSSKNLHFVFKVVQMVMSCWHATFCQKMSNGSTSDAHWLHLQWGGIPLLLMFRLGHLRCGGQFIILYHFRLFAHIYLHMITYLLVLWLSENGGTAANKKRRRFFKQRKPLQNTNIVLNSINCQWGVGFSPAAAL